MEAVNRELTLEEAFARLEDLNGEGKLDEF